jgi:hypothetical protein
MLYCFLNTVKNSFAAKEERIVFRDCAEVLRSGHTANGIYVLTFPNSTDEIKVTLSNCIPFLSRASTHPPASLSV